MTRFQSLWMQRYCLLAIYFLFLVQLLPSSTAVSRAGIMIKSSNQPIKLLNMFVFEKRGGVDLWGSNIAFSSSSNSNSTSPSLHDLSQIGFYLSPRGKEYHQERSSMCYLHSDTSGSKKIIYTLDKLKGTNQFNTSEELEIEPGYYSLFFENCAPNVEVSMVSGSDMYNLDGSRRHHLNRWTNVSSLTVYALFLALYVVAACHWCSHYTDSSRILDDSCNLVESFRFKLLMLLAHITYNLFIDQQGDPKVMAVHWLFMNIATSLFMMSTLLFLQSGCAVREPLKLSRKEKLWGYLVAVVVIVLWLWEAYSSLEPCDAYSLECFLRLNAIRCARSFAVILMLYVVWKDNTDTASVQLTKSLIAPRSNLFFFALLPYSGVMHFSFLLSMFPYTSAAAIAFEESATLALFWFIYYLYLPPPSAPVADDDLEAKNPKNNIF